MGLEDSPWYVCGYPDADTLRTRPEKTSPSCNTEKIAKGLVSRRMADQLSPHHDSQFSAFSAEVLDRMNQKHNRCSSPFTTLAEGTKPKVANTVAGQPNY